MKIIGNEDLSQRKRVPGKGGITNGDIQRRSNSEVVEDL